MNAKSQLLYILAILMIVNAGLSGYLQMQKNALISGEGSVFGDECFVGGMGSGNCADVQMSEYSTMLGVDLSIWGLIAFPFMALLLGVLAYSIQHVYPMKDEADLNATRKFIYWLFPIMAIGAAYFIYLQLVVLDAICRYCIILDSITIVSAIIYMAKFKKSVSFNTS